MKTIVSVAAIVLFASVGVMAAVTKEYRANNGSEFSMEVDESWQQKGPPANSGGGIFLVARDPQRLQILVTPMPGAPTDADVKRTVDGRAKELGPHTVEKTLAVRRLDGKNAKGYYFKATDPAPKPGEHVYMYQGIAATGGKPAAFTILFNAGAEKDASAALAAVGSLRFKE